MQLYSHNSENNMLHIWQYLFHEFLFVYLFIFLPGGIIVKNDMESLGLSKRMPSA